MSMIKCPDCNKEISEKSKKCIHCGCPINSKKSKKKKICISIIAIFIISLFVGGLCIYNYFSKEHKKNEIEMYQIDLENISSDILSGAAEAEDCGNLIRDVWYNSIWKEDDSETDKYTKKNGKFNEDFNDSLSALFSDEDFSKKIESIKNNRSEVKEQMKDMKNPPEEYEEAYDALKEYYDNYLALTNLCIDQSGNYNKYSSDFSDADNAVSNGYNKLQTYLED